MARIHPDARTHGTANAATGPELDTLELLRRELPDDYTVFHSIRWSNAWRGIPVFGEIDFVVVNQSGDVLVIEQKNGVLREADDKLFKDYREGSRDVGRQIHRSMDGIRQKFQRQHGLDRRLERLLAEHGRLDQTSKAILEINPGHALVRAFASKTASGGDRELLADAVWLLFDEAKLVDGEQPVDVSAFAQRLFNLMSRAIA